jgi:hypothetical protein
VLPLKIACHPFALQCYPFCSAVLSFFTAVLSIWSQCYPSARNAVAGSMSVRDLAGMRLASVATPSRNALTAYDRERVSAGEREPLHQLTEPRLGAQRIEPWIHLVVHDERVVRLDAALEQIEREVALAKRRIGAGKL